MILGQLAYFVWEKLATHASKESTYQRYEAVFRTDSTRSVLLERLVAELCRA